MKRAPAWLADLQARFGAVLRTPLDRGTGTLRATLDAYDPAVLDAVLDAPNTSAAERLAVYQRQYWFRLFTALQTAFPLTAHLVGPWQFNEYAAQFLVAHPPQGWDIEHAADGFDEFLASSLAGDLERAATIEASRIDAAWRDVFRAPAATPFRPSPDDAARLLDARLDPSPSVAVFVEHWALVAAKRSLADVAASSSARKVPPHPRPQWWALVREGSGIRQLPLEPREGQLIDLLRRHRVRDALAHLEAECSDEERATLPANARRWLARSVENGFWRGLVVETTG